MTRRRFLRALAVAGTGATILPRIPGAAWASRSGKRKIYRLSRRGQTACNACRGHAAHRFFRSRPAARRNRAHQGCDCTVKAQWVGRSVHADYFGSGGRPRDVHDDRWG